MGKEDASLRGSCVEALDNIDLPCPFSIEAFCSQLEKQRNRPLLLHPMPDGLRFSEVCGVWVATEDEDYIFYESQTSRVHQEHIILHEIGHVLFGHGVQGGDESHALSEGMEALLPDLFPHNISRFFGRTNYTTRQEREAEMLASLIGVRARRLRGYQASEPLTRLGSAFGLGLRHGD